MILAIDPSVRAPGYGLIGRSGAVLYVGGKPPPLKLLKRVKAIVVEGQWIRSSQPSRSRKRGKIIATRNILTLANDAGLRAGAMAVQAGLSQVIIAPVDVWKVLFTKGGATITKRQFCNRVCRDLKIPRGKLTDDELEALALARTYLLHSAALKLHTRKVHIST